MVVGFGCSSSINGSDEILGCESLQLSRVHLIEDGVLIFCHIAHEEESSGDLVRSIVNRCLIFLYDSSNLGRYNSLDE